MKSEVSKISRISPLTNHDSDDCNDNADTNDDYGMNKRRQVSWPSSWLFYYQEKCPRQNSSMIWIELNLDQLFGANYLRKNLVTFAVVYFKLTTSGFLKTAVVNVPEHVVISQLIFSTTQLNYFCQRQPPIIFCKIGVLKNFAFTRKDLCQTLFFYKVSGLRPATLLKRDSSTGVFLGNLRNF